MEITIKEGEKGNFRLNEVDGYNSTHIYVIIDGVVKRQFEKNTIINVDAVILTDKADFQVLGSLSEKISGDTYPVYHVLKNKGYVFNKSQKTWEV